MESSMLDLFNKGGMVMYILVLLSVYATGVILFKIYQFSTSGALRFNFIHTVMQEIKQGDKAKALAMLRHVTSPVARVMESALQNVTNRDISMESKQAEVVRVGTVQLHRLEGQLRGLEMVSNVSPLLGLLGTVIGMVKAFSRLEEAGARVDPSVLAGGIWEALLTTVAGISVAIPALAAHYIFDGFIEKIRTVMKDTSVQIFSLEDEFAKYEREMQREENERKEEERLKAYYAVAEKREEKILQMEREEAERRAKEMLRMEAEKRAELEKIEQEKKKLLTLREKMSGKDTLRLLNPRY